MRRIWILIFFQLPFLTSCSNVFYQPDRALHFSPSRFGLQEKEIRFHAQDGTRLVGWYFRSPSASPKGTVIQFHGNGENMSSHFLTLAWVVKQGYNLFVFDYRGYGKSEGSPSQEGVNDDGLAALEQAWRLHLESNAPGGPGLFVVFGQSLGGAVAMRALSESPRRNEVDLVVMDSSFLSYKTVARRTLAGHWLTWLFSPLAMVLVSDEYSPEKALTRNSTRLLVMHDELDPVVSFRNGQEIFEAATSQKEIWTFKKGRHISAFAYDTPENQERFARFLDSLYREKKVSSGTSDRKLPEGSGSIPLNPARSR